MNTRMKIAFGCHFLYLLGVAAFGLIYLLRAEFMPYHSVAVGVPWSEVSPSFQVLLIALMRAVGAGCLTVTVLGAILLLIPFRQGAVWARWAIPAGGLVFSAGGLYAMSHVALNTPATPPWIAVVLGATLLLTGLVVSVMPSNQAWRN